MTISTEVIYLRSKNTGKRKKSEKLIGLLGEIRVQPKFPGFVNFSYFFTQLLGEIRLRCTTPAALR